MLQNYSFWCTCGQEVIAIYEIDFEDGESVYEFSLFKDYESSVWDRVKAAFRVLTRGRLSLGDVVIEMDQMKELRDYVSMQVDKAGARRRA